MEVLERNKCIVTGNTDLKNVYTFKKFPVYCGCVDTSVGNDLFWTCHGTYASLVVIYNLSI